MRHGEKEEAGFQSSRMGKAGILSPFAGRVPGLCPLRHEAARVQQSGKAFPPFAGRGRRNARVPFPGRGNGGIWTVDILPSFTGTVPRMLLFQPEPSHVYQPFSGGAVHAGRVRNIAGMSFSGRLPSRAGRMALISPMPILQLPSGGRTGRRGKTAHIAPSRKAL